MSPTEPAPIDQVDFEVDGLDADEEKYRDFFRTVAVHEDMLVPLAEHHDGPHSYYVLFDRTATWGHLGMPQVLAVDLQRDREKRTFDFEQARLPLPAMAQSWLIHRGCPPDAIGFDPELGPPADEATRALERRLAEDGGHYAMGYSYTSDDPDDMVTVVVLRARDAQAPGPFRVLVEEVDTERWTHTLREGGFDTAGEARQWCETRLTGEAGPLPPVRPADVAKASAPRPPGHGRRRSR